MIIHFVAQVGCLAVWAGLLDVWHFEAHSVVPWSWRA